MKTQTAASLLTAALTDATGVVSFPTASERFVVEGILSGLMAQADDMLHLHYLVSRENASATSPFIAADTYSGNRATHASMWASLALYTWYAAN